MYRIRFHGRGGEGIKTSSRMLGNSFFLQGYEVQDAPRYGAERRGAPVFAYVRADRLQINERGPIHSPDLIIISDDTLLTVTPETVLEGISKNSIILLISGLEDKYLQELIPDVKRIITINPADKSYCQREYLSTVCASFAAGLTGVITLDNVIQGITDELEYFDRELLHKNINAAQSAYSDTEENRGIVSGSAGSITEEKDPGLILLPFHSPAISTPGVKGRYTSIKSPTGSWRVFRPVVNTEKCSRCMLCNVYCPDGVISTGRNGYPLIDYEHCKGCLVCSEICPSRAIDRLPEASSRRGKIS